MTKIPPKAPEPSTLAFPMWALWLTMVRGHLPIIDTPDIATMYLSSTAGFPLVRYAADLRQWQIDPLSSPMRSQDAVYHSEIHQDGPVVRIQRTLASDHGRDDAWNMPQTALEDLLQKRRVSILESVLVRCAVPFDAYGKDEHLCRFNDNMTASTKKDRLMRSTPTRENAALRALRSALFINDVPAVDKIVDAYPKILSAIGAIERVYLAGAACASPNPQASLASMEKHRFLFHRGIRSTIQQYYAPHYEAQDLQHGLAFVASLEARQAMASVITRSGVKHIATTQ